MQNYISYQFKLQDDQKEILIAFLDKIGLEGIIENEDSIEAYLPEENRDLIPQIEEIASELGLVFEKSEIAGQNWNAKWESNFEPLIIANKLSIRAPFHDTENTDLEIVIEPKMSFGTGHHATTHLMTERLLNLDLKDKSVLDAGSGTGILSILSELLGASKIIGFDIEEWAFENAIENAAINKCSRCKFYHSDAGNLPFGEKHFDIILANITKNILKADIPVYLKYLRPNGIMLISGFFDVDVSEMETFLEGLKLEVVHKSIRNNWAVLQLS